MWTARWFAIATITPGSGRAVSCDCYERKLRRIACDPASGTGWLRGRRQADGFGTCEVGEGAGDFEDAIMGAGGEVHFLHRVFEVTGAFRVDLAAHPHSADLLSVCIPDFFGATRRQVVVAGHDGGAGMVFEFEPGAFGNAAAGFGSIFIFRHASGIGGFGDLAGG